MTSRKVDDDRCLISVIMTVRNGAPYLQDALDSLFAQTDDHFEIVVVDDGSTDATPAILARQDDQRLRVKSHQPIGRAEALAEAAQLARGELIAVLDADDLALRGRLATQRAFLDRHPEIGLVGSAAIEFDGDREWSRDQVSGPHLVRRALGMHNPFYHSSVMFRRTAYLAAGGYLPDGGWGHDLDLLIRIATRFPVDIISEPLIRYRRHPAQVSDARRKESFRRRKAVALQLRAARDLSLPLVHWIVPLLGAVYAYTPSALRPRIFKDPLKRSLLRLFRVATPPSKSSIT